MKCKELWINTSYIILSNTVESQSLTGVGLTSWKAPRLISRFLCQMHTLSSYHSFDFSRLHNHLEIQSTLSKDCFRYILIWISIQNSQALCIIESRAIPLAHFKEFNWIFTHYIVNNYLTCVDRICSLALLFRLCFWFQVRLRLRR